jgi:hypothetical protein
MLMRPSVIAAAVMVHGVRRVRTTQHDFGSAIDRLEHEADGDQRPEHERRRHPQRKSQPVLSEQKKSRNQGHKLTSAPELDP